MFTQGTLRYTALIAVNAIFGFTLVTKPELVTQDVFLYLIAGDFLVAGADILKHIKDKIKPTS